MLGPCFDSHWWGVKASAVESPRYHQGIPGRFIPGRFTEANLIIQIMRIALSEKTFVEIFTPICFFLFNKYLLNNTEQIYLITFCIQVRLKKLYKTVNH